MSVAVEPHTEVVRVLEQFPGSNLASSKVRDDIALQITAAIPAFSQQAIIQFLSAIENGNLGDPAARDAVAYALIGAVLPKV